MGPCLLGTVKLLLALQSTGATVSGFVRNEVTGAPVVGAIVALTDLNRTTTTDATGHYALRQVPAGPQHLSVRFIGYAARTLHALVPPDGLLEINISLRADPFRLPTIQVRPDVAVRGLDSAGTTGFPDRAATLAAVRNHPLLAEPDVLQVLSGGEVVMRPESPSGVHVRGGATDHLAYLLDGIPVLSPYHTAGLFSAWNPDALARVELWSAAPTPAFPDALSGAITAVTRPPSPRIGGQGSFSTTQARLTVDGPLGASRSGAGYLMSVRRGFPDLFAPKSEQSYLRGESADWLVKLEVPVASGRARLLGYGSDDEIKAAAATPTEGTVGETVPSNNFEWWSRSLGVEWRRGFSGWTLKVLGWSAAGDASSHWAAQAGQAELTATRRDAGLLASVERSTTQGTSALGFRVLHTRASYRVHLDSTTGGAADAVLSGRTPVLAAFAEHTTPLGRSVAATLSGSLATAEGSVYPAPRAQVRWTPSGRVMFSASYARLHQFVQSLRNAESVVGNIFPVDLWAGAGAGIPVARSDQGVIAAEYRPWAGVRLGAQAYERRSTGLVLVAPREGEPFITEGFVVGFGRARGASFDAAVSSGRVGVVASYGLQRVRLGYGANGGDSLYAPEHGATHLLEGGVTVFPSATSSIRLGAMGILGRRATAMSGTLEWEACNLLDRGCEFGGSPHHSGEPLGGTALPGYFRMDLGVRKHWHIAIGGRDASIAVFGTVTNLFGSRNVLTYGKDPTTGQPVAIEMRPRAPLVVGLDWQF